MPRDPEKARARQRRYREKVKAAKYGPESIGVDMRGKHDNHARGQRHPRWNPDRIISEHGYTKIRVGETHPLADPNGYAYEHLLVWVSAGNPRPSRGEVIHHGNEDKADNRITNLHLLTRSAHGAHHASERDRNPDGTWPASRTRSEFPLGGVA